jgi:hypothetical protein
MSAGSLLDQYATARTADPSKLSPVFQESQVARLSELAREVRSGTAEPPVIIVTGPPGAGKTSVVNRFAEKDRRNFPDGVYRLSLAHPPGSDSTVDASVDDIISQFSATGQVPDAPGERCSLLQEILASREILLIIDDAGDPSAVSALLPGPESRSLILIVSREDLISVPGRRLAVGPAELADSVALIREIIGDDKFSPAREQVTDIALSAEGRPLVLRIAAGAINRAPGGAREIADQIHESSSRQADGPTSVLASAYESLRPYTAMVLRALACAEAMPMPLQLVPFLLGQETESAELHAAVTELVGSDFIAVDGGSIFIHDMVADFIRARTRTEESADWLAIIADRGQRISFLASGHRLRPEPRPEPLIARDFWTLQDQLSHAYYGAAIADFIRHPQTLPPLTIGLKAPWGAGKTSLMRMIQDNLDPRKEEKPCRLQLDVQALGRDTLPGRLLARRRRRDGNAGITNLDILRQASAAEETAAAARLGGGTGAREAPRDPLRAELAGDVPIITSAWRPTVWFNPWMYQNGEQTWAGLAYEIISQVTERLRPLDREVFWLLLNLSRVDPSVIRRRWYRLLVERSVPLILAWTATIAVALISLLIAQLIPPLRDVLRYLSSGLSGAATVVLVAGGLVNVWTFLNRRPAGPLSSLVHKPDISPAGKAFLEGQFKGSFDQLVPDPGYGARLGFLHLVQTDMHRVLRLIATPERPLVIFVDDLDRCSPGTVSQVIEAINLFLAGEFPNCIFVLGMEPSSVASHIESAYPDLVRAQRDGRPNGGWSALGWRFLDKIVQLPLSVPGLRTDDDVARYLRSLMRSSKPGPSTATAAQSRPSGAAPYSGDTPAPERGGPSAPSGDGAIQDDTDYTVVIDEIERSIRARHPSPETIRDVALDVQQEVLGRPAPILSATVAAASRILADLYSDADAYVILRDSLTLLPSRNPREIKRFVNLFRFYSFIAERGRLVGNSAASKEQIAKVAAFAIRWPSVVSMVASVTDADSRIVRALENAARADDAKLWDKTVRESLPGLPLPDVQVSPPGEPAASAVEIPCQSAELCQFMREDPEIGSIVAQFF